jgi:hypothetical protein
VLEWRRKWSSHLDGLVFNVTATCGNHHSCLKFANCPTLLALLLQMDEQADDSFLLNGFDIGNLECVHRWLSQLRH